MHSYVGSLALSRLFFLLAIGAVVAFVDRQPGAAPMAEAQTPECHRTYQVASVAVCSDTWMAQLADTIGQRPLEQVVMPGAHDAGTYHMNDFDFWIKAECDEGFVCLGREDQFITQNDHFVELLKSGVRWFDLRFQWTERPPFGAPFDFDYYVNHGVGFTDLNAIRVWDQLAEYILLPEYSREIVYLDLSNAASGPHAQDTGGARFNQVCEGFKKQFHNQVVDLLITPQMIESHFPGRQLPEITMNELWSLPGHPRIITNWEGCIGTNEGVDGGRYYANECWPDPNPGFTETGIIERIDGALPSKQRGDGGNYKGSVNGLYFLSVASTLQDICFSQNPNVLTAGVPGLIPPRRGQAAVINHLTIAWDNLDLNARAHLNYVDGDYVLKTDATEFPFPVIMPSVPIDLPERIIPLNAGPKITTSTSPGTAPGRGVVLTIDCTAWDKKSNGDPLSPGKTNTVSRISVAGAVDESVNNSPTLTVNVPASGDAKLLIECVETSGKIARLAINPPAVDYTLTPPANAAGWHNGDVTVNLTATEHPGGSGVLRIEYRAQGATTIALTSVEGSFATFTLEAEGTTIVTSEAVDSAFIQSLPLVFSVNIDRTAPVITASAATEDGNLYTQGTWANQPVTVTFACTDALSGVAQVTGPRTISFDAPDLSTSGTCDDVAGNSASLTFGDVDIDRVAPALTASATTADGEAYAPGTWANQPVTVTFACTDPLSGVESVTDPVTLTADGAGQSADGTCLDRAGNTTSLTFGDIDIDKTSPILTASATTADGEAYAPGTWTNQDVTVTFACTDPLSGVASISAPVTLGADAGDQEADGACTDNAGNSASLTFGNIDIDKSGPQVSCSVQPNRLWPPNHKLRSVSVSITATDALSAVAGFKLVSATSNEPDSGIDGENVADDIQGFIIGEPDTSGQLRAERSGKGSGRVYTLTYEVVDTPGNISTCHVEVTVPHNQ